MEAKREDLSAGVAQCVAEMVAARLFNEKKKNPTPVVYGCVTSGQAWRFLRLEENAAQVDAPDLYISEMDRIFGILMYMATGEMASPVAL